MLEQYREAKAVGLRRSRDPWRKGFLDPIRRELQILDRKGGYKNPDAVSSEIAEQMSEERFRWKLAAAV